ncbi:hypothetical protein ABZY90_00025 [Streptomyces sp. NPDC006422]|uniref:hypothetical protein n=1 Tax=unclassified Streptomyces TaxID=2593676 RepID=UPI0033A5E4AF
MSIAVPLVAIVVFAVLALVALPFFFFHVHVGSAEARGRRQQEILRSLDGRPEVKVLASGTGWSVEQTVWVARQHGYELTRVEGYRARPRCLVLGSTQAFTPFPSAPPQGAYPPPPGAPELRLASREIRKAGNPGAVDSLAALLGLLGVGAAVKAAVAAQGGELFTVPALLSVVLLAGAAVLFVAARRMARRNGSGSRR